MKKYLRHLQALVFAGAAIVLAACGAGRGRPAAAGVAVTGANSEPATVPPDIEQTLAHEFVMPDPGRLPPEDVYRIAEGFAATIPTNMLGMKNEVIVEIVPDGQDSVTVRYRSGMGTPVWRGDRQLRRKGGFWVIDLPDDMPDSLRATLAPNFVMPDPSRIPVSESYGILAAFGAMRHPKELAQAIQLTAPDTATVQYHDGGFHGGGEIRFTKTDGKWRLLLRVYPL